MSSFFPPLSLNCPSIKFHHLYPIFPNLPCCPQNATFQLRVHVGYLVAEATQCRYFVGTGSPLPGRRRPTAAVVLPSAATGCLSSTAGHATSTSCESFYFQSSFPLPQFPVKYCAHPGSILAAGLWGLERARCSSVHWSHQALSVSPRLASYESDHRQLSVSLGPK